MTGYVTGAGNRLLSDGTNNYTYDNEGNTLTKTRISDSQRTDYTWDYRNRLTNVTVKNAQGIVTLEERFTYDVGNRRIGVWEDPDGAGPQSPTQMWTVYNGANTYADFNGAGSLTTRYIFGNGVDQLLGRIRTGQVSWYLTDNLGSVRQIVDSSGNVLDQIAYGAFGTITSETNPANGDRFTFTGRELDRDLGQYYYRARFYPWWVRTIAQNTQA